MQNRTLKKNNTKKSNFMPQPKQCPNCRCIGNTFFFHSQMHGEGNSKGNSEHTLDSCRCIAQKNENISLLLTWGSLNSTCKTVPLKKNNTKKSNFMSQPKQCPNCRCIGNKFFLHSQTHGEGNSKGNSEHTLDILDRFFPLEPTIRWRCQGSSLHRRAWPSLHQPLSHRWHRGP